MMRWLSGRVPRDAPHLDDREEPERRLTGRSRLIALLVSCGLLTALAAPAIAAVFMPGNDPDPVAARRCATWAEAPAALSSDEVLVVSPNTHAITGTWFSTYPRMLTIRLDSGEERTAGPYERVPQAVRLRRVIVGEREFVVVAIGP